VFFVPFRVLIEKPFMPSPSSNDGKITVPITFNSRYTKNVTKFLISSYGGVITRSLLSFGSLPKTIFGEIVFGGLVFGCFFEVN
jgi:hypothetical protein